MKTRIPVAAKLLIALLIAPAACISAIAQAQTMPLLMSEELDDRNNMIPLVPEIINTLHAVEVAGQLQFDIRRYPWKRAMINAESGEGVIFGISKTPERLRRFTYSDPVMADVAWLVAACDATFPFASVSDLKGKTIGIVRGTTYGEEFDRQANVLFKADDDTNSNPARMKKLLLKRTDAIVMYGNNVDREAYEASVNKQYAESATGANDHGARLFCVLPKPISVMDVHFAVRPDLDKGIIRKLNAAIALAKKRMQMQKPTSSKEAK
ncbi:substrate-binding periplasmic protein [Undibacterium sp. TJN25]|uniref:substrate-binding periplasmic protein n=1 Tax=Undibacterium sp. TJN25 TaxID=3413056 RepID=UPI003BF13EF3